MFHLFSVILALNQEDPIDIQYTGEDKPEEQATSPNEASHKPDDNASSEPVITITTTSAPDPSVPMTTAGSSDSGPNQNSSSSSSSIVKSDDKNHPGKDVATKLAVSKPVENHGNDQSKHFRHDNKSPGSPPKADVTAGMKVKPPKFGERRVK